MDELLTFLQETETKANDLIDKLITTRQSSEDKAYYRYVIKKLEVIVGAVHRAQDKMPVEFKLDAN